MSATGLPVFDKTIQETNMWLKSIEAGIGPDRKIAYDVLRAVLHALRDRLTVEQASHLSAQLPMLVRGIYFEGWHPAGKPEKIRALGPFLERIAEELSNVRPVNTEVAARSVFRTLAENITAGEAEKVKGMLPEEIRSLWPNVVPSATP
ncbi:MAG: DUF2267 domain-containing protein [Rhodospirillales bacterium]|nr:MAG: DUF2267 domain-containing protein [Rhodospirillales bacterium]